MVISMNKNSVSLLAFKLCELDLMIDKVEDPELKSIYRAKQLAYREAVDTLAVSLNQSIEMVAHFEKEVQRFRVERSNKNVS